MADHDDYQWEYPEMYGGQETELVESGRNEARISQTYGGRYDGYGTVRISGVYSPDWPPQAPEDIGLELMESRRIDEQSGKAYPDESDLVNVD